VISGNFPKNQKLRFFNFPNVFFKNWELEVIKNKLHNHPTPVNTLCHIEKLGNEETWFSKHTKVDVSLTKVDSQLSFLWKILV
jgi:hypothetical protein